MELPSLMTVQGAFEWLLIVVLAVAALAGLLILASWLGWLPPIDQLDGTRTVPVGAVGIGGGLP